MSHAAPSPSSHSAAAAPFARILCGVNGTRPAQHAVEQALGLAGSSAHVHFVAVCDVASVGATRAGTLGVARGKEALAAAHEQAPDAGVDATTALVHHSDPSHHLSALATEHDLPVVGSAGQSRAMMAIGGTAGLAAHTTTVPVLVPRSAVPGGAILVATDGHSTGRHVVDVASRLAGVRPLLLVHATAHEGTPERHELGAEAAAMRDRTGRDPVVVAEHEDPVDLILSTAREHGAALIVIGSRGRTGLHALGSVSERVSARAGCSAPVLRPWAEE